MQVGRKVFAIAAALASLACAGLWHYWGGPGESAALSSTADKSSGKDERGQRGLLEKTDLGPQRPASGDVWALADHRKASSSFAEAISKAEAGDVVAQRTVADFYSRCSLYSLSPSKFSSTLDTFARLRGEEPNAYDGLKRRMKATCGEVDGGRPIPRDLYFYWYERAARQGDAYSRVALASFNYQMLTPKDVRMIGQDVINAGDPEAIFALGDLLAIAPEGSAVGDHRPVASPYANLAWGIVACRMGADCGPGSFRMDALCMNTGVCDAGDFEQAVRSDMVPTGQQELLDKAIREVQNIVGSSN